MQNLFTTSRQQRLVGAFCAMILKSPTYTLKMPQVETDLNPNWDQITKADWSVLTKGASTISYASHNDSIVKSFTDKLIKDIKDSYGNLPGCHVNDLLDDATRTLEKIRNTGLFISKKHNFVNRFQPLPLIGFNFETFLQTVVSMCSKIQDHHFLPSCKLVVKAFLRALNVMSVEWAKVVKDKNCPDNVLQQDHFSTSEWQEICGTTAQGNILQMMSTADHVSEASDNANGGQINSSSDANQSTCGSSPIQNPQNQFGHPLFGLPNFSTTQQFDNVQDSTLAYLNSIKKSIRRKQPKKLFRKLLNNYQNLTQIQLTKEIADIMALNDEESDSDYSGDEDLSNTRNAHQNAGPNTIIIEDDINDIRNLTSAEQMIQSSLENGDVPICLQLIGIDSVKKIEQLTILSNRGILQEVINSIAKGNQSVGPHDIGTKVSLVKKLLLNTSKEILITMQKKLQSLFDRSNCTISSNFERVCSSIAKIPNQKRLRVVINILNAFKCDHCKKYSMELLSSKNCSVIDCQQSMKLACPDCNWNSKTQCQSRNHNNTKQVSLQFGYEVKAVIDLICQVKMLEIMTSLVDTRSYDLKELKLAKRQKFISDIAKFMVVYITEDQIRDALDIRIDSVQLNFICWLENEVIKPVNNLLQEATFDLDIKMLQFGNSSKDLANLFKSLNENMTYLLQKFDKMCNQVLNCNQRITEKCVIMSLVCLMFRKLQYFIQSTPNVSYMEDYIHYTKMTLSMVGLIWNLPKLQMQKGLSNPLRLTNLDLGEIKISVLENSKTKYMGFIDVNMSYIRKPNINLNITANDNIVIFATSGALQVDQPFQMFSKVRNALLNMKFDVDVFENGAKKLNEKNPPSLILQMEKIYKIFTDWSTTGINSEEVSQDKHIDTSSKNMSLRNLTSDNLVMGLIMKVQGDPTFAYVIIKAHYKVDQREYHQLVGSFEVRHGESFDPKVQLRKWMKKYDFKDANILFSLQGLVYRKHPQNQSTLCMFLHALQQQNDGQKPNFAATVIDASTHQIYTVMPAQTERTFRCRIETTIPHYSCVGPDNCLTMVNSATVFNEDDQRFVMKEFIKDLENRAQNEKFARIQKYLQSNKYE